MPSCLLGLGDERRDADWWPEGSSRTIHLSGAGSSSALVAPSVTAAASEAPRLVTASSRCSCLGADPVGEVGVMCSATRCL